MHLNILGKGKRKFFGAGIISIALLIIMIPTTLWAQDPTGAKIGTLGDIDATVVNVLDTVTKAKDSTVTSASNNVSKLAAIVQTIGNGDGHNRIAINIMWTLITGFLVMFMQAGFALVETGFTQKKNVAHTMAMNFLIYI